MKDIKTMLYLLQHKKELTPFNKLNLRDINHILSFLANVPIRRGNLGLSARSYHAALHFTSDNIYASDPEGGVYLRSKEGGKGSKVPQLVMLNSLGNPVALEGGDNSKYTLAVPNLPLPEVAFKQEYMPIEDLAAFVTMHNTFPASKYLRIDGKQVDNPRMSGVCPYVLLAFKLFKGVKYSEWDRTDSVLDMILPGELAKARTFDKLPDFTPEELRGFLEMISHTQKTKFRVGPKYRTLLNIRTAIQRLYDMGMRDSPEMTEKEADFNLIPPNLQRILLQTWIYTKEYRTSDLILDLVDWDKEPDDIWEDFIGFGSPNTYSPTGNKQVFHRGGW